MVPGRGGHELLQGLHVAVGQALGHGLDGLTVPVQHQPAQVAVAPSAGVLTGDGSEDLGAERVEVLAEFVHLGQIHTPIMADPARDFRNLTKYY